MLTLNGLELKNFREETGLTQQQLANKLDVNIRTVQKWEGDESKIRKSVVLMIESLRKDYVSKKDNLDALNENSDLYQTIKERLGSIKTMEDVSDFVIDYDKELLLNKNFKMWLDIKIKDGVIKVLSKDL